MLNEKTTKELKMMAKDLGVKNWWNMKKVDLIEAIENAQNEPESNETEVKTNTNETLKDDTEVVQEVQEHTSKKHNKRLYTYNDKTQNLTQWAKELNIPVQTLYGRLIHKSWPVEKAFTTPTKRGKQNDNE